MMTLTGRLQGNLITLEEKPTQLEGRLLRIVVEPIEDSALQLSPEEQRAALNGWIEHGPQGPLPDDSDYRRPDATQAVGLGLRETAFQA